MDSTAAFVGGFISIVGTIVAAWPALPLNSEIDAEGAPEWTPTGGINGQDAMIRGRRYALAGIAIAIMGQAIGLFGS